MTTALDRAAAIRPAYFIVTADAEFLYHQVRSLNPQQAMADAFGQSNLGVMYELGEA